MTDRGESALKLSEDTFTVGPSHFHWNGTSLDIEINEVSTPHCDRVHGSVRVHPLSVSEVEIPLHRTGRHIWRPFAPTADIEVNLNKSGWQWTGSGYFDANFGTAAIEDDFSYWTWGRFPLDQGTACFYDAIRRDGSDDLAIALRFDKTGGVHEFEAPPPKSAFNRSLWAVWRETRSDTGFRPKQTKMMLDAPFYCRAGVQTQINGEITKGVHEALDLDRFKSPLIKPMLAMKVPRRRYWSFS